MIGGNIVAELQLKSSVKNEIGENISSWDTIHEVKGFLDLSSGDSNYSNYNAKIQESTHVLFAIMLNLTRK